MLRIAALAGLIGLALVPAAHAATNCGPSPAAAPLPLPATVIAPAASELFTRNGQLGMPSGVLAQPFSADQSVDRVLLRLRVEGCQDISKALPAGSPANPNDPAAYKPQTAFDNTPWRFNMSQDGKRMTAEEFDAWMKARGVRVVKARPAAPAAAAPAADTKPAESK
ncbi:hypothetical protein P6166_05360 [Stenotrophomonas sp. HITSZ_GD]|uniref:hypothetical protein n=1 Tax=Stenotrophomonas sp. HITSZ_GD TaxID=3037248 RepID=UPI00240E26B6|nr:hypothetical protein [Stenotrophomonas sp. HITSZ_GD]MDG2524788.1 hypothetical protein [Stenotrophomonas sp. HITSZ_GD]